VSTTMNRSSLVLKDGTSLRFDAWADYFASNMPDRLAEELRKSVALIEDDEHELNEKLAARFGKRLRAMVLQARSQGPKLTTPIMAGSHHRKRRRTIRPQGQAPSGRSSGPDGNTNTGRGGGPEAAVEKPQSGLELPEVIVNTDEDPDVPAHWDGRT